MGILLLLFLELALLGLLPRWWLLALLGVGFGYLFKWPLIAEDAEDLIFHMPPIVAWFTMPAFLLCGLAVVAARKWSRVRGSSRQC